MEEDRKNNNRKRSKRKSKRSNNYNHVSRERDERDSSDRRRDSTDKTTTDERLSPLNDFSWYNHNPALVQAAASLPFPYRPGMRIDLQESTANSVTPITIPGIMGLSWCPTIGTSRTATDPAAVAGKEIYAQVRNAFSGSLDVDAPDFIIYFMALDSIFSLIGMLKRAYRILNTYTPMNYDIPDNLLVALGIPTTWKQDRMLLYQYINELVGLTHKFQCPAVFDIFNRHYWMNDNVYTDAASANSQMYVFRQSYFYKFAMLDTPTAGVQAGGLSCVALPLTTVKSAYDFGKQLIEALAGSDDAYTISGYLRRAYDGYPLFTVDELRMDEVFTPVFVPEVLQQIENSMTTFNTGSWDPTTNAVSQDPATNALICVPKMSGSIDSQVVGIKPFLSIRSDMPSVVDVVEASRLTSYVDSTGNIHCASEIPLSWTMFVNGDSNYTMSQIQYVDCSVSSGIPGTNVYNLLRSFAAVEAFDWRPMGILVLKRSDAITTTQFRGDVHNVTTFSPAQLDEIHKMCLYSLFNSFNLQE